MLPERTAKRESDIECKQCRVMCWCHTGFVARTNSILGSILGSKQASHCTCTAEKRDQQDKHKETNQVDKSRDFPIQQQTFNLGGMGKWRQRDTTRDTCYECVLIERETRPVGSKASKESQEDPLEGGQSALAYLSKERVCSKDCQEW